MTRYLIPTWLWLRWHRRHGTGPILNQHAGVRALDPIGQAYGPDLTVTWYRCECTAVRTVSREPTHG